MSEEIETGVSHIAYFRTDGGSPKLYTQEYVDDLQNQLQQKENIINEFDKWLDLALEVFDNIDVKTLMQVKRKLQELKGDSSNDK
jgi:hypothetical protein